MTIVPIAYRVNAVIPEVERTVTLIVEPQNGPLPEFRPGQFAMLSAFGNAEVPISVSRINEGTLCHTIRAVGDGSAALAGLRVGDSLGFRGPFGTAWPVEAAVGKDVLIIAGGLGMAPLRPVVDAVLAAPERFGNVSLLYGTREPSQVVYGDDLERWVDHLDLLLTVDQLPRGTTPRWRGHVGLITKLVGKASYDPANTVAYVCGPEIMMRFCAGELGDYGVPASRIFVSLERNMKCAIGLCGHCQLSDVFICRDGPVFSHDRVGQFLTQREL